MTLDRDYYLRAWGIDTDKHDRNTGERLINAERSNSNVASRTALTLGQVVEALPQNWMAQYDPKGIYNGALFPYGFELHQGEMIDGEFETTADSLPVLTARTVGNDVRFALLDGSSINLSGLE